ncbi:MAG: DUF86 domain-containing protein [Deltaproteobacteria bacterium]|nr:DUF86 domain-containing protein [Deltaproteobacteria bacterium]
MKRTARDYIADILICFKETQEFTQGIDFNEFEKDRKTINAVLRSLEVMGEASKRIPMEIRERYPDIPWKRMTGMRDKLIHEYSGVDLEIVWIVVKEELPLLKQQFEKLRQDIEQQES